MAVNNEYFELRDSALGGQGLFATKFIPKGTCILVEKHIACVRNFTHIYDQVNSYFDFPKIMPPTERNTDLLLLGAIIGKLDQINRKYGDNWHEHLYKSDYDTFAKRLTMNERKYIATLCVEYKLAGGFRLIVDIYNSIVHNVFKQVSCYVMNAVYYALDYTASKINHSCQENCRNLIFPKHTTMVTVKDVEKDSELTINYGENFLKHNNIKCKCGACDREFNLFENGFSVGMGKRELLNDYQEVPFNIAREIPKYLEDEKADKEMMFGGLEVWYHLLYEVNRRTEIFAQNPLAMGYGILFIHYIRAMMKDLSRRNGIDEDEVLMFFVTNTKISAKVMHAGDYFFTFIKAPMKEFKLTFNCDRDFSNILSPIK